MMNEKGEFHFGLKHPPAQVLTQEEPQGRCGESPRAHQLALPGRAGNRTSCDHRLLPALTMRQEPWDEGDEKARQLTRLSSSKPGGGCPPSPNTPKPLPLSPQLPQARPRSVPPPTTLPRRELPSCGHPRSPSTTIAAPALTAHPTLPPPKTETPRLVSPLHILPHQHPPHFLALASLPAPQELSPTSPRSTPHPQTPSPRLGKLPASGREAQPPHVRQAPLMPAPGQGPGAPALMGASEKGSEEDDAGPTVRLLLAAPGALG